MIFSKFFFKNKCLKPLIKLSCSSKRSIFLSYFLKTESEVPLDENLYWDYLHNSLESESKNFFQKTKAEKNVFVLQLKMQYKSKSRQSTTPELQLAESVSLIQTIDNWKVIDSHIVGTKRSHSREIFGSGNQEMLSKKISSSGADTLFVVIDRLTNMQVKGLRMSLLGNDQNIAIYDRYKVVLEIFKRNARSSIAKLQIALAEIPYLRHKFENNDLYKSVEKRIKKELELKLRTRSLINTQRREKQIPLISVFGYTNVGKTTFIKAITKDNKLQPKNQLFATLDITYHGTKLCNSNQDIIFADTIGFISDIPHNLIEAFKTSLSDALDSDLYIHLVDLSHPDREAQEKSVNEILSSLAPQDKLKDMLTVYNKSDKCKNLEIEQNENKLIVSCTRGYGLDRLINLIEEKIIKKLGYLQINLKIAQGSEEFFYLNKNCVILEINECENSQFVKMKVLFNKSNAFKFINLYPNIEILK